MGTQASAFRLHLLLTPCSMYNSNTEERVTDSSEMSICIYLHGVTSRQPVFFARMTQIPVWWSKTQEVRTWQMTQCGPFVTTAAHHGASQQHGLSPHRADLAVQGRGRSAAGGYECAPLNRRSRWNSYRPLQQAGRYHCYAYETSQFVPRDRLWLWASRNFPQTLIAKSGIILKSEYDPFLEQLLQLFITLKALSFSAILLVRIKLHNETVSFKA
jgi:hypothetical protein